jgi:hypothetical protein
MFSADTKHSLYDDYRHMAVRSLPLDKTRLRN